MENIRERIKPFKCTICDYKFSERNTSKQFMRELRKFNCNICDYNTTQKGSIQTHIESWKIFMNQ